MLLGMSDDEHKRHPHAQRSRHSTASPGMIGHDGNFMESFKDMLGDIYAPLKTGLKLEHVIYNACYMLLMLYGFFDVADASKQWAAEFYIEPPRWSILTITSLGSTGYNGTGDAQWTSIDRGFGLLLSALALFVIGARGVRSVFHGENGVKALQRYYLFAGFLFTAFLHGPMFWLPITIIALNYVFIIILLKIKMPHWVHMAVMWTAVVSLMLSVGYYGGRLIIGPRRLGFWGGMASWVPTFNMSILRMISFNTDLYEAIHASAPARATTTRKHDNGCLDCARLRDKHPEKEVTAVRCYKFRSEYPRNANEYNLLSYMAYMLYPPLYIGGPMSSFNAFASHCQYSTVAMTRSQLIVYGIFIIILYVTQVSMLHFVYLSALRQRGDLVMKLSTTQAAFMLYYSLAFLWLKFSLVWKTGRLAAVADGVDVPEDMRRAYSNTLSVRDFWRDWHASFNVWVVRYMYIPMGGNRRKYFSILPIFFFIAVWHDLELHLIEWAVWIIAFFLVELFVGYLWGLPLFAPVRHSKYERLLRSLAGMVSVFGLTITNMIGFATVAAPHGGSLTAQIILHILGTLNLTLFFFFLLFFFLLSATGVLLRDEEANQIKQLKERYGIVR